MSEIMERPSDMSWVAEPGPSASSLADADSPDDAVIFESVSKVYPILSKARDRSRYLWHAIMRPGEDSALNVPSVRALDGIKLRIKRGERVGIIGRNGAGKSTLLKLLTDGFRVTRGDVRVNGKVYALLPAAIGFDTEMSASENAKNFLTLNGVSASQLGACLAEIEAFCELGSYFDQPLKTYSLGMQVRAQFATATAISADVIVIDEVLGAGDIYWAEKCARRMDELCSRGSTMLLVSHSMDQILRFCQRGIWIERGRIALDGNASEVVRRYESFVERLSWHTNDADDQTVDIEQIAPELGSETLPSSGQDVLRWPGRGDVLVSGLWFDNESLDEVVLAGYHPHLKLQLELLAVTSGKRRLRYLFTIWTSDGDRFGVFENENDDVDLKKGQRHQVSASVDMSWLPPGDYQLSLTVFELTVFDSSSHEQTTRQDVLWKSFRLLRQPDDQVVLPELAHRPSHQPFRITMADDDFCGAKTEIAPMTSR